MTDLLSPSSGGSAPVPSLVTVVKELAATSPTAELLSVVTSNAQLRTVSRPPKLRPVRVRRSTTTG